MNFIKNAFVVGQFICWLLGIHLKSNNSFDFIKQFKIVIVVGMKEHLNSKIYSIYRVFHKKCSF